MESESQNQPEFDQKRNEGEGQIFAQDKYHYYCTQYFFLINSFIEPNTLQ